jgi:hypothetical protein
LSNLSPKPISSLSSLQISSGRQQAVKAATPDVILVDDAVMPIEAMQFLSFDSLSGVELIEISRHDTVNGQLVNYGLLKEVAALELENSSKSMIPLPQSSDNIFQSFPIKFARYIPQTGLAAYLNENGDIVIEVADPETFIDLEIEVFSQGQPESDTIY